MIDPDKQDVALRNKSGEPIVFRLQLSRSRYYSQLQLWGERTCAGVRTDQLVGWEPMLMLLCHPTRQALPVKEPLNGRSFESARSLDEIGHDLGGGGHIDLDHRNGMEMLPRPNNPWDTR
jgi:hypothetical protein